MNKKTDEQAQKLAEILILLHREGYPVLEGIKIFYEMKNESKNEKKNN